MKICIGIISYFPDNEKIRDARSTTLLQLLDKCNSCFNIPIFIVAQNYTREDAAKISSINNVTLFEYQKLGIVGARKEVRKLFLESEYDYLIMLDDDCLIRGTPKDGRDYLQTIQEHPGGFGAKRKRLLKLLAVSKEICSQVDIPDVNPEANEGYEDAVFYETLRTKFRDKEFNFTSKITEVSNSSTDPNST